MARDVPYAPLVDLLHDAATLAEVGLIVTTLEAETDPSLAPWLQHAVQTRYHAFTRRALPDGPEDHRLGPAR